VRKRYSYVDGLLRVWVRLYARGWPPAEAEIAAAARAAIERDAPSPPVEMTEAAEPPAELAAPLPVVRRDSLIEFDGRGRLSPQPFRARTSRAPWSATVFAHFLLDVPPAARATIDRSISWTPPKTQEGLMYSKNKSALSSAAAAIVVAAALTVVSTDSPSSRL